MRYRLEAGTMVTMENAETIIRRGQITWDNGRIVSIGEEDSDVEPVDQVIRIPEGIVMPGLYNGHNHAAMTLFRGLADDSPFFEWLEQHIWPAEARLTRDDIYWGTLLATAEMIRSGTVGFADMYFEMDAVAEAVAVSGMRGWLSRGLVGDQDPDFQKLYEAAAFAARWRHRAEGRIVPMLGPHAPYTCSPEYLAEVARVAKKENLAIHIHLAESQDEIHTLKQRYGRSPIELARDTGLLQNRCLIAHGVHMSEDDMHILANHLSGGVVSCPISNAKLGNGILPYPALLEHGITVGLGTDGAGSTNTLDMFLEMKTMAWLQKVRNHEPHRFTAWDALSLATRGTSEILGFEGGMLAPGQPADFIVLDGARTHLVPELDVVANIVYAATGADVTYSIIGGQIVMAEGIITTFDEGQARREVRGRARQLVDSKGR
ncbi:MAG: amidohydrolase family protein [Sulfobacillus sp.]